MLPTDLTTLDRVKTYLGLTTNHDDPFLQRMLSASSDFIVEYLSRPIKQATYTEKYDGKGMPVLFLRYRPVISIASLSIAGSTIGSGSYSFDDNRVALTSDVFPRGTMNISITYDAGYATVPPNVENVCIEMTAYMYREAPRLASVSKGLAGETVSFYNALPEPLKIYLEQIKDVVPV